MAGAFFFSFSFFSFFSGGGRRISAPNATATSMRTNSGNSSLRMDGPATAGTSVGVATSVTKGVAVGARVGTGVGVGVAAGGTGVGDGMTAAATRSRTVPASSLA